MVLPKSDTGIYVASGVFTIAVFVIAVAVFVGRTELGLTTTTILTLSIGFFAFMGVYFVSMAVYRGIEKRERSE